jgi:hypothetical protein
MEKTGIRSQGDHKDVNQEKGPEAVHRGEQDQAEPAKTRSNEDEFSGSETIDQISNHGSLDPAFEASRPIKEGNRRAGNSQVTLQRKEEYGKAVVEDSGPDRADQGAQGQHPPSVKYPPPRSSESGELVEKIRIFRHQEYGTNLPDGFQPF